MIITGTDLSMVRGDTESIVISCDNYIFSEGDKVEFTVRKNMNSPKVIYKKITEFEEDGSAIINIIPENTQTLKPDIYKYDVSVTLIDGSVSTIIPMSDFTIEGDITYDNEY